MYLARHLHSTPLFRPVKGVIAFLVQLSWSVARFLEGSRSSHSCLLSFFLSPGILLKATQAIIGCCFGSHSLFSLITSRVYYYVMVTCCPLSISISLLPISLFSLAFSVHPLATVMAIAERCSELIGGHHHCKSHYGGRILLWGFD